MLDNLLRRRGFVSIAAFFLISLFALQMIHSVRGQSLSWDEDDHIFSGYMTWKTADYGLNPEHPPLVKLLATVPLLPLRLFVPRLQNRFFKEEAYMDGQDFLFGNGPDYPADVLIFRVRMAAMLLSLLLAVIVFFAAREMFGPGAALFALTLLAFEPNLIAHGAYVTTDMGLACFFFATVYAFYRYVKQPTTVRLLIAGLAGGLALASKHSAILLLPTVVLLIAGTLWLRRKDKTLASSRSLWAGLGAMILLSCVVLWAFYGFRYNARPDGLALSPSLADYTHPLRPAEARGILLIGRLHLLPESYLYGLTDVRAMANGMQSYIFQKVYEHGVWFYFPVVFLIKSTLGFLALFALGIYAIASGRMKKPLEALFLLVPPLFYLAVAMGSSLNIGARHILPLWVFFSVFAAGAAWALAGQSKAWRWVVVALLAFHVVSSLRAYPNDISYANELWGGPKKTYIYLTDSNTDWGQQLKAVKKYTDKHHITECWFAYFVQPFVRISNYGIPCKPLPTFDTQSVGETYDVPEQISGTVFLSAGDISGYEFGSAVLNPYNQFWKVKPDDMIQDSVLVYKGTFTVPLAHAYSHVIRANTLLKEEKLAEAYQEAQQAVADAPNDFMPQYVLGQTAAALAHNDEARAAYNRALAIANTMEPEAKVQWNKTVTEKLNAVR